MASGTPNRNKTRKMEVTSRSWTHCPILHSDLTDDLPLEDVYVGLLKEKKDISEAIKSISAILPGFRHLKRCSSSKLLLAPLKCPDMFKVEKVSPTECFFTESRLKTILKEKGFNLSWLEDDFEILRVPARAARTKTQAVRASKIWPMNFHPDPNVECLMDGSIFTERQLNLIEGYMKVVVQAAKLSAVGNSNCNGSTVIVDPEDGRILAIAASRVDRHPMWHACMLAVDLVAKLQGGGAWELLKESGQENNKPKSTDLVDEKVSDNYTARERQIKRKYMEETPLCYPTELSSIVLPKMESLNDVVSCKRRQNNGATKSMSSTTPNESGMSDLGKCGPYLCTGYWTFLLMEPCPLCAMALLHSRVSRILYGTVNENTGVLGSKTVLHAVPGLNHRYQVWRGVLENGCHQALQEIKHRNTD